MERGGEGGECAAAGEFLQGHGVQRMYIAGGMKQGPGVFDSYVLASPYVLGDLPIRPSTATPNMDESQMLRPRNLMR